MQDEQCVHFLQWALSRLHLRWPGFRRVHRQVCKRIDRRIKDLELEDIAAYRAFLNAHPEEWSRLDTLCRITLSRFYRNRKIFACLEQTVLPTLVRLAHRRGDTELRVWSAGCGSGEEAYTLTILWRLKLQPCFPDTGLSIVATDVDPVLLQRARRARYAFSSLKELPSAWRDEAFSRNGDFLLKKDYRPYITFMRQDVREQSPEGRFDLILCRNLAFTYFDEELQRKVLRRIQGALHPGGTLILGKHEQLPEGSEGWCSWFDRYPIYRKKWPQAAACRRMTEPR
ncbi:CheR family methyltransferase [Methylohalobius crimeensis]|uniref:CheR family methyltransferase n=1 Tax=Methylohalobius crimeensis TaxID=244365 RepID=UPI0003B40D6A|nr:protein-glutamate O-methyltransferase CheR [Methylohalobius crimeensis]